MHSTSLIRNGVEVAAIRPSVVENPNKEFLMKVGYISTVATYITLIAAPANTKAAPYKPVITSP